LAASATAIFFFSEAPWRSFCKNFGARASPVATSRAARPLRPAACADVCCHADQCGRSVACHRTVFAGTTAGVTAHRLAMLEALPIARPSRPTATRQRAQAGWDFLLSHPRLDLGTEPVQLGLAMAQGAPPPAQLLRAQTPRAAGAICFHFARPRQPASSVRCSCSMRKGPSVVLQSAQFPFPELALNGPVRGAVARLGWECEWPQIVCVPVQVAREPHAEFARGPADRSCAVVPGSGAWVW